MNLWNWRRCRWPSVSLSVVEHLNCQCLPVSAPSTDLAATAAGAGRGRNRSPRLASGPEAAPRGAGVSPALAVPSFSPSSSSRASTTGGKQTPAPADVVFANDSREERTRIYYETCQACKKQWDYCEVSPSVCCPSMTFIEFNLASATAALAILERASRTFQHTFLKQMGLPYIF